MGYIDFSLGYTPQVVGLSQQNLSPKSDRCHVLNSIDTCLLFNNFIFLLSVRICRIFDPLFYSIKFLIENEANMPKDFTHYVVGFLRRSLSNFRRRVVKFQTIRLSNFRRTVVEFQTTRLSNFIQQGCRISDENFVEFQTNYGRNSNGISSNIPCWSHDSVVGLT